MAITIKVLSNTVIKRLPIDSEKLPDSQKHSIKAGVELFVSWVKPEGDHLLVSLSQHLHGFFNWYLYAGHVSVTEDKKLSDDVIRKDQAENVFGRRITDKQFEDLNRCLGIFHINTLPRVRHFLAQIAHESCGLRFVKELASGDAYEGRPDLGNIHKGDGRRFKGAGVIQLTGRRNYQAFARYMGDTKIMEGVNYVADRYPFTSAGFWWMNNRVNNLIDAGATVKEVTKKVNGGYNGLADRIYYYRKACLYV